MKSMLLQGVLMTAIACMTAGPLAAQAIPPTAPEAPVASSQRADDEKAIVTATGCLKQEKDVPGGKPNIAERAGLGEDFILTSAKLTKGRATGSTVKGAMYKIEGLDDEKLRAHINQEVEVTGRLQDRTAITGEKKPTRPSADTPPDEVQQIHATTIRMIAASCKAGTN